MAIGEFHVFRERDFLDILINKRFCCMEYVFPITKMSLTYKSVDYWPPGRKYCRWRHFRFHRSFAPSVPVVKISQFYALFAVTTVHFYELCAKRSIKFRNSITWSTYWHLALLWRHHWPWWRHRWRHHWPAPVEISEVQIVITRPFLNRFGPF